MNGAPPLSPLLSAGGVQPVLIAVLVILFVLVLIAVLAAFALVARRRSRDAPRAMAESSVPPSPSSGPAAPWQPAASDALPAPSPPATAGPAPQDSPAPADSAGVGPGTAPPAAPEHPHPSPASLSPTQTPDDVDRRSPAELAAAAQAAESAEDDEAGSADRDDAGAAPLAIQHEVAIGPVRPVSMSYRAPPDPARLRMLGLTLGMLTERMRREDAPQLGTALARLVDSEEEAARAQMSTLALSLLGEDEEPSGSDGQLGSFLEEAVEGEARRGFSFSSMPEFQQALSAIPAELREKLQTIVWARTSDSVAILTTEDVETLERVAVAMATAHMLDTSYDVRRLPGEASSGRS